LIALYQSRYIEQGPEEVDIGAVAFNDFEETVQDLKGRCEVSILTNTKIQTSPQSKSKLQI
jgi:hypothetical protein